VTSWVRCGFCELHWRLFCVFMYPTTETTLHQKSVNCGSISPSTTDCRNQPQNEPC
jgi:hypothetical protein